MKQPTETNNTNNPANVQDFDYSVFSVSELLKILILHWPWILISVIVALGAAKVYLHFADPVYSHNMSLLIKEEKKTRPGSLTIENMGMISNSNGFDNELMILKSSSINVRVVKALRLYTNYNIEGRVQKHELYNKETPVIVDMPMDQLENLKTTIKLDIKKKGKGLEVTTSYFMGGNEPEEHTQTLDSLPGEISTPHGTVLLQQSPHGGLGSSVLHATIMPIKTATKIYSSRVGVAAASKTTTVALISMNDTKTNRALDYLRELFIAYNADANEDKNEVAQKTEEFIKKRIENIRAELDDTELGLERYKKNNEMVDISSAASMAMTGSTTYQSKQVEIQTQINLLDALAEYVDNPSNYMQVIPANLGLSDAGLNATIKEYNEYVMQRKRLLKSSSEDNPMVQRATSYVEELWPHIKMSISAIRKNIAIQKESADEQYDKYNRRLSSAPTQERELTNISRQQNVKSSLYLMLLQRQEENYISLASTAAKARFVEEPQLVGIVKPRKMIVWGVATAAGLAFPFGIFILIAFFRTRIEGRNDVEILTPATILADVPLSEDAVTKNEAVVVKENSNDMMEESFRGLRTNLRFILTEGQKVILCSSCIPGEGKTFISTNLAMSLALMGKKTVLVGLDIRKPRLLKLFHLPNEKKGITNFLTSTTTDYALLDEQIYKGVVNANLDILPAGIIPPNPSELLSREKLDKAIDLLREHYDYILLDTPPLSLVSDTLAIGRVTDATIIVCRADYSPKSNFGLINSIYYDEKLPNVNIVINGVDLKRKKYGYYYGYGKYGKYGSYNKYGNYGRYGYGNYGAYGHYGMYGKYGNEADGKAHLEK